MTCSKCKESKQLSDFYRYDSSWCKACRKQAQRTLYRKDPKRWILAQNAAHNKRTAKLRFRINEIKQSSPCMDCHQSFPAVCMDFDHRDSNTKFDDVSNLLATRRSWKQIETEIAKCDVVCSNCHRLRTQLRGLEKVS